MCTSNVHAVCGSAMRTSAHIARARRVLVLCEGWCAYCQVHEVGACCLRTRVHLACARGARARLENRCAHRTCTPWGGRVRVRTRAGPIRRGGRGSAPVRPRHPDGARRRLRGGSRDGGGYAGPPAPREDGRTGRGADLAAQPPAFR